MLTDRAWARFTTGLPHGALHLPGRAEPRVCIGPRGGRLGGGSPTNGPGHHDDGAEDREAANVEIPWAPQPGRDDLPVLTDR